MSHFVTFCTSPESVSSKEKVLKKLQLSRPYCKSFADSWPPCYVHCFLSNLWVIFVRCLQPINRSEIPRLFFIKLPVFCFYGLLHEYLVSLESFLSYHF